MPLTEDSKEWLESRRAWVASPASLGTRERWLEGWYLSIIDALQADKNEMQTMLATAATTMRSLVPRVTGLPYVAGTLLDCAAAIELMLEPK